MPEYLQKRFGGKRIRIYYAVEQLALAIISGISVSLNSDPFTIYALSFLQLRCLEFHKLLIDLLHLSDDSIFYISSLSVHLYDHGRRHERLCTGVIDTTSVPVYLLIQPPGPHTLKYMNSRKYSVLTNWHCRHSQFSSPAVQLYKKCLELELFSIWRVGLN
jgi:hypothetical protein